MKGIDIAKWNPVTDYALVAKQVDFAVLKIINKQNNEDSLFSTHLQGCRANGIPILGVYNYSYAETAAKARADATAVINTLKKHDLNTIVWLDVEEEEIARRLKSILIDVIFAYKETIEAAGYTFGIYTGMYYYKTHIQPYIQAIEHIPLWIARYPSSSPMTIAQDPIASKKPDIVDMVAWQYSSKGQIAGIKGNVDLDISYLSYEEIEKFKQPYDPNARPILRKGDRNEYVRSWQTLLNINGYNCGTTDGWFGDKTEDALIRWQQDHGIEAGYVGPQTWKTLEN